MSTDVLSRLEASKEYSVSPRTLDRWVRQGVLGVCLKPIFQGTFVYFDRADIDFFLKEVSRRKYAQVFPPKLNKAAQREQDRRTDTILRSQGLRK